MRRIKRFIVGLALVLVGMISLVMPLPSLAAPAWTPPIPTPSQYGDRVYSYEQTTRFWINENGYQLGTSGANIVSKMWSSVFAIPGGPTNTGYTAVTGLDESTNSIDNDNTAYQTVLQNFLEAFNVPYDSATNSWLVSPAYNTSAYGAGSAFSQKSGLDFDVPIHFWYADPPSSSPSGASTPSGVTLTPPPGGPGGGYTIGGSGTQSPYPLYVGAAADVGAGYQPDGSVAYWEGYGGPDEWGAMANGTSNMSEQGAVTLYDTYNQGYGQSGVEQDGATTGNVIMSYPFGTEVESLDVSSGKATATVLNSTPYDVIGENWYAYVESSNQYAEYGSPQLLTQGAVNIGAQPLGNTTPNQGQLTFSVPSQDAGDELIVTLNETLNSNGSVTPEGLPVYYAWGPNSNTQIPADGSPKDEIAATNVYNVTTAGTDYNPSGTAAAYADNAMYLVLPGSSGGSGTIPALVVTPATATVPVGGQEQYIATYYPNGQAAGNGQTVTTQANWYAGNTTIATVIVTGNSGGLATGVSQGTTGITADYGGLQASAQIQVTQAAGYNIKVTSVTATTPAGAGVQPGQSYTATVNFASTFPVGGNVRVDWYQEDDSGQWQGLGIHQVYIAADGTASDTQSWTFPASGTSQVTIQTTVDDPFATPTSSPVYQPLAYPATGQMESDVSGNNDPDNYVQQSVAYRPNQSPSVNGFWASGYVVLPIQTPVQETKTYTVTPMGVKVPIVDGPNQTWGPPHFYLSY